MKKDRDNFNLVWPIPLIERAKKEADLYGLSVSQLLATALLMVPLHHEEMAQRIVAMRHEFFPEVPRESAEGRPSRSRRRVA